MLNDLQAAAQLICQQRAAISRSTKQAVPETALAHTQLTTAVHVLLLTPVSLMLPCQYCPARMQCSLMRAFMLRSAANASNANHLDGHLPATPVAFVHLAKGACMTTQQTAMHMRSLSQQLTSSPHVTAAATPYHPARVAVRRTDSGTVV
jgi:hypothetical protein